MVPGIRGTCAGSYVYHRAGGLGSEIITQDSSRHAVGRHSDYLFSTDSLYDYGNGTLDCICRMDDGAGRIIVLNSHSFTVKKLTIVMSASVMFGCGMTDTIDTSGTADSNRAMILGASRGTALFSPRPVVIKSVDGNSVAATADSVRVAPGIHVLVVTCYQSLFARNTHEMTVSVEAGECFLRLRSCGR